MTKVICYISHKSVDEVLAVKDLDVRDVLYKFLSS